MTRCPSGCSPGMMMGTIIFTDTPSLGDCQPRLKINLPAHEIKIYPARSHVATLLRGLGALY